MSEGPPTESMPRTRTSTRRHGWDALGVVIAAMIGLLALLVSGYTAWIQRQQVRAQVWPHLTRAYVQPPGEDTTDFELAIFNKGVGPAIVRSVQVVVDGKPYSTWVDVFGALGLPSGEDLGYSTLNGNVLSAGETLPILVFKDQPGLTAFRRAFSTRAKMRICYCSTLGECWMFADHDARSRPDIQPVNQCAQLSPADTFKN